jgi:hypothetical protein
MISQPIERLVFDTNRLMTEHPPVLRNQNKKTVYAIACPLGCVHNGELEYTRWCAMALPDGFRPAEAVQRVDRIQGVFDYAPLPGDTPVVEWHVNFADPHLFVAYGSGLFAQDEMQVAEHPALGALKQALTALGHSAVTEENGAPTPVLVKGVERRCHVATDRNAEESRPNGLYGNAFAAAPVEVVRRAKTTIDPPTVTNLIAIAAPSGGFGRYTVSEIERILTTAYTGFRAAVLESGDGPAVVHTGFWGCGAFGGNRVLMTLLQVIAAEMAGVDRLVFHTVHPAGSVAFDSAMDRLRDTLAEPTIDYQAMADRIEALGFTWGVSDGN